MSAEIPAESREAELEAFTREMAGILEGEKRGTIKARHFSNDPNFNPRDLQPADMLIWQKFQAGSLTRPEFDAYATSIVDPRNGKLNESMATSRETFLIFMRNKAVGLFMRRDILRHKKE